MCRESQLGRPIFVIWWRHTPLVVVGESRQSICVFSRIRTYRWQGALQCSRKSKFQFLMLRRSLETTQFSNSESHSGSIIIVQAFSLKDDDTDQLKLLFVQFQEIFCCSGILNYPIIARSYTCPAANADFNLCTAWCFFLKINSLLADFYPFLPWA